MKYVLLAIFVLFAAQPLQAYSCNMHANQDTSHSQHADMQDSNMEDMDCCDDNPADPGDGCACMSHCGACMTAAIAISPCTAAVIFSPGSAQPLYQGNEFPSDFSSPPFRPPIA